MMNMVRSMLKDKNLPHELCGEAVNTSALISVKTAIVECTLLRIKQNLYSTFEI